MKRLVCMLAALLVALSVSGARAIDTVGTAGPSVAGWTGTAYQAAEIDNGNSGTSATIDWTAGNNQALTMTGNAALTFTPPGGAAHLTLRMIQDGSGAHTVSWPTEVSWDSDTEPTWDTTAGIVNIAVFYFDGTGYYGSGMTGMPVAQPVATYLPDTGQAGTAADGEVGINTASETFANLLLTTPNLVADDHSGLGGTAGTLQVLIQSSATTDEFDAIVAPLLCFDTDDGTIIGTPTGATLTVYGYGSELSNPLGGNFDIHLVDATPTAPGTFVAGDFNQIDTTSLDSIAYGSLNTSGPNVFTVPAAAIHTDAKSCFALVPGDFTTGTFTGSWSSGALSYWTIESVEGTNKPMLEVTW